MGVQVPFVRPGSSHRMMKVTMMMSSLTVLVSMMMLLPSTTSAARRGNFKSILCDKCEYCESDRTCSACKQCSKCETRQQGVCRFFCRKNETTEEKCVKRCRNGCRICKGLQICFNRKKEDQNQK